MLLRRLPSTENRPAPLFVTTHAKVRYIERFIAPDVVRRARRRYKTEGELLLNLMPAYREYVVSFILRLSCAHERLVLAMPILRGQEYYWVKLDNLAALIRNGHCVTVINANRYSMPPCLTRRAARSSEVARDRRLEVIYTSEAA